MAKTRVLSRKKIFRRLLAPPPLRNAADMLRAKNADGPGLSGGEKILAKFATFPYKISQKPSFFRVFRDFRGFDAPHGQGGWVPAPHLIPIDSPAPWAGVAMTPAPQKPPAIVKNRADSRKIAIFTRQNAYLFVPLAPLRVLPPRDLDRLKGRPIARLLMYDAIV